MDFVQALILSIVEGVTEFLPISSTGHLVLASKLLGVPQTEFVKSFEIFIQLGAILAVVFLYFNRFKNNYKAWKNIVLAFLPTAFIGLVFYKVVKEVLLGNTAVTLAALFLGGIVLILINFRGLKVRGFLKSVVSIIKFSTPSSNSAAEDCNTSSPSPPAMKWRGSGEGVIEKILPQSTKKIESIDKISAKNALLIGLVQSISIIPGVSRAAATIIGGLFLGLDKKVAVEFSFLLAVPTMLAATGLDLVKSDFNFAQDQILILAIGFIGSFITALIVVKWFIKYVESHSFFAFGVYRIVLALMFWLL